MKILSDNLIDVPFVSRAKELEELKNSLFNQIDSQCNQVILIGKSGVGKTVLSKELLNKIHEFDKDLVIIYCDLNHDDFTNNLFLELLLGSAFVQRSFSQWNPSSISEELSFKSYLERKVLRKEVKNGIYMALVQSLSFIPSVGGYIEKVLPKEIIDIKKEKQKYDTDFRLIFLEYFRFLTSKVRVCLVLDNYQFLPSGIRTKFESTISSLSNKLALLNIIRSIDHENELDVFRKYQILKWAKGIVLSGFDLNDIKLLLTACFPNIKHEELEKMANECLFNTSGNLKEIEQYILSIRQNGLIESTKKQDHQKVSFIALRIGRLNQIQADILMLASLFPNGLKLGYVKQILDRNYSFDEESDLSDQVSLLIQYNFIYLNGSNQDLLKPAHEKVIKAVKDSLNEDRFLEVRKSCIDTFKKVIEGSHNQIEYANIISNLLGILWSHELKSNIKYFIKLVNILYKTSNFYQIIILLEKTIFREDQEDASSKLLSYLPDYIVEYLLDSCQKTSNFEFGLTMIKILRTDISTTEIEFFLYNAKYLLQLYKYKEALKIITANNKDIRFVFLHLNLLQHQRKDKEAKSMITELIRSNDQNSNHEYFYIILRNSGHLFDYDQAITNLTRSLNFFRQTGNLFGEATCLNNIGLVHLYFNDLEIGYNKFEEAEGHFLQILSNEIYQPRFNKGLYFMLTEKFEQAIDQINSAINDLPSSLEYDYIKFLSNLYLCEMMICKTKPKKIISLYNDLIRKSRLLPDPWLLFLLSYNRGAMLVYDGKKHEGKLAQEEAVNKYIGEANIYGVYKQLTFNGFTQSVILSPSPHWRY